jgi:ribosomal protein L7/L12
VVRILKDVVPPLVGATIGAALGPYIVRWQKQRADLQPPASVVTMWALESHMTEEQQKIRVIQRGSNAIADIKAIRKVSPQLGLAGAKYIVDHTPQVVCVALHAGRSPGDET